MIIAPSTLYGLNSKTVLETVSELEKAGFDTMELVYEFNNLITPEEAEKLREKKLSFSMHCPFIGMMFTHLNKEFSLPQIRLIEKSLEIARQIGCSEYVMHGGLLPGSYTSIENPRNREFFVDLFIDRFGDSFRRYADCGVKILIENLTAGQIGGQFNDIIRIQNAIPEVGFCYDIAHAEITKQTDEIFKRMKIDYVHATDNDTVMQHCFCKFHHPFFKITFP